VYLRDSPLAAGANGTTVADEGWGAWEDLVSRVSSVTTIAAPHSGTGEARVAKRRDGRGNAPGPELLLCLTPSSKTRRSPSLAIYSPRAIFLRGMLSFARAPPCAHPFAVVRLRRTGAMGRGGRSVLKKSSSMSIAKRTACLRRPSAFKSSFVASRTFPTPLGSAKPEHSFPRRSRPWRTSCPACPSTNRLG
jgi:hypothetical protein